MPGWWRRRLGLFLHAGLATVPAWSPLGHHPERYRAHLGEQTGDRPTGSPLVEVLAHHRDRWSHVAHYDDFADLLTFDRFGNAVTSIRETDVPNGAAHVVVKGHVAPLVATYGSVSPGSPLGLVGSTGRVEISIREGSARAELKLQRGDPVVVQSVSDNSGP